MQAHNKYIKNNNFKRRIEFIDGDNHKAILDVEVTDRNGYPEFTASGQYLGSYGQCLDDINPITNEQHQLFDLWREYHLKNIDDLPANVAFSSSLSDQVNGLLDAIEEREKNNRAQKGDDYPTTEDLMQEFDIAEDLKDAVIAYLNITEANDLRDFNEAYAGEFGSDEEFAENMANEIGAINNDLFWPRNCIDWTRAARELMLNYSEEDGYYFRNL